MIALVFVAALYQFDPGGIAGRVMRSGKAWAVTGLLAFQMACLFAAVNIALHVMALRE